MRHLTAIFFLLIFSLQVLPVKAIGKLLSKSQQTEEVKDDCGGSDDDTPDNSKEQKYSDLFHHYHSVVPLSTISIKKKTTIIHGSDDLPKSHVKDILCPPPNC